MSAAGEFVRIEGEHFVTVLSDNQKFPHLAGVRGLLKSSGPNAMIRVLFDGQENETELSAFDVVEYGADAVVPQTAGPDVGIYFGTETGNTETAAEAIRDQLAGCRVSAFKDIADCPVGDFLKHDVLLMGVSTWNIGDIQYNWEEKLDEIEAQDYSGIKVAIFGLGDAAGYPDTFVDGMGILWDRMKERGAQLIGIWPTEDYEFDESKGLYDESHFLGVVLDEDGEAEKSPERISTWIAQLLGELGVSTAEAAAA